MPPHVFMPMHHKGHQPRRQSVLEITQSCTVGSLWHNPKKSNNGAAKLVQEAVTANFRRDEAQPQHFLAHQPLCCAGLGFCTDGYLLR